MACGPREGRRRPRMTAESSGRDPRIVVLAGPGDSTSVVVHGLRRTFGDVAVVLERSQSRWVLARRRASRLGWLAVIGQVLFVSLVLPALRWRGRARVADIVADFGLDCSPIDGAVHEVASVNGPETRTLLRSMAPDVVVVNGTRIIGRATLETIPCPVLNLHTGITPQFRGVHGAYWALAEGHPELVGTTVHLVDAGIDTGGVLAQATFAPERDDSIATYPYLHLGSGLPLLVAAVERLVSSGDTGPTAAVIGPRSSVPSRLWSHPTAWGYLWRRITRGVR